jgi:hypothetical protein
MKRGQLWRDVNVEDPRGLADGIDAESQLVRLAARGSGRRTARQYWYLVWVCDLTLQMHESMLIVGRKYPI